MSRPKSGEIARRPIKRAAFLYSGDVIGISRRGNGAGAIHQKARPAEKIPPLYKEAGRAKQTGRRKRGPQRQSLGIISSEIKRSIIVKPLVPRRASTASARRIEAPKSASSASAVVVVVVGRRLLHAPGHQRE